MTQQPSVGRIVHYHSYGTPGGEFRPEARAAIITAVHWSDTADGEDWQGIEQGVEQPDSEIREAPDYIDSISLAVLNPTGMFFNENVPFSDVPAPGHWSWPPRT
ncbi:hypothetical protein [Arthrobacter sp. UYCu712]|uniref:hypothetical protein n=1 Tax=Arthrobacter sp. UYCu712 TaxID=3156340 RepID=UPI003398D7C0